jgi:hypothetical protein
MQFLVLIKATAQTEAGALPTAEEFAAMEKFSEDLGKAGVVMQGGGGLQPSSKGARLTFSGGKTTVTDGPFAETKELVAGFCIVEGTSKEEVIERFLHAPFDHGQQIEIRPIFMYDAADVGAMK